MDRERLLERVKTSLRDTFGERLQGVVLYGSEARGQAASDSDIDVLVLLLGPVVLGQDLRTIIEVLYPLQLEVERPIHALPVDIQLYEAGEFALFRNAQHEGMRR